MSNILSEKWDITVKEVILSLVLSLVLGWVVGVICCVLIIKYMQCMAGKILIFGPRLDPPVNRTQGAVVNPVYNLDSAATKGRESRRGAYESNSLKLQSRNNRPIHEYADVLDPPTDKDQRVAAEVTPSGKTGSVGGWVPSSQRPGNAGESLTSLSLSGSCLQGSVRQSGRRTNAYSMLDKKTSYFTLQPHIQDGQLAFKEPQKGAQTYNLLDYHAD